MKSGKLLILGNTLEIIMEAGVTMEKNTGKSARQIIAGLIKEGGAHNAAQVSVYNAINELCWCESCSGWHVTSDTLSDVVAYLQQMVGNIEALRENLSFWKIGKETLDQYDQYLGEAINTLLDFIMVEDNADSNKVVH